MTNEENKRRSADPKVNYIKSNICDKNGNKSYVFISYKSDDWETVLQDIVYRLVKDYGLNVYFDGSFDSHNSLWIKQFPENMRSYKCRGVIAFFDDRYATSYATLMELLYSQTKKAAIGKPDPEGLPIVPIDLEKLTEIKGERGEEDTGLGVKTYKDESVNVNADSELELFIKSFNELVKRGILKKAQWLWEPGNQLNAMTCSEIVRELKAYKRINENHYSPGMSLEGIVGSIRNACGPDVFDQNAPHIEEQKKKELVHSTIGDIIEEETKTIPTGHDIGVASDDGKQFPVDNAGGGRTEVLKKVVSDGSIFHIKGRNGAYDAFYRKKGDSYTVLSGSRIRYNEKWTPKRLWEQYKNQITDEGILLCDIGDLPISTAAKLIEGTSTSGIELDSIDNLMAEGDSYEVSFDPSRTVVNTGMIGNAEETEPDFLDGFKYTIFGKEYAADSREQGKLMYDAFEALVKRHPDSVEKLTQRTSVSKAKDVKTPGTKNAYPKYFRGCKEFRVNGNDYLVGTSYGFKAKIAEIKGMFSICGEDVSEFVLNGKPLESGRNSGSQQENYRDKQDDTDSFDGYEYCLWDISHNAGKLVDMLNDVFDLIAEKYPDKIQDIAVSHKLSAVARKDDLEQGKVDDSRARQFKNYKGKDHSVGGIIYCVNAGYNFATAKKQIENMLIVCEGNSDGFRITKEKERSTRSGSKSGKRGIGELINQ